MTARVVKIVFLMFYGMKLQACLRESRIGQCQFGHRIILMGIRTCPDQHSHHHRISSTFPRHWAQDNRSSRPHTTQFPLGHSDPLHAPTGAPPPSGSRAPLPKTGTNAAAFRRTNVTDTTDHLPKLHGPREVWAEGFHCVEQRKKWRLFLENWHCQYRRPGWVVSGRRRSVVGRSNGRDRSHPQKELWEGNCSDRTAAAWSGEWSGFEFSSHDGSIFDFTNTDWCTMGIFNGKKRWINRAK